MDLLNLHIVISELNDELFTNDDDYHLYLVAGSWTEAILLNDETVWDDQNDPNFETREELKSYIRGKIAGIINDLTKALRRNDE